MNRFTCLFIILLCIIKIDGQTIPPQKEMSLQYAIELGLKNNPELKASSEKINAAKGRYHSGISLPSPEVSVSYEYIPTGSGIKSYGEKTIEIKQSLDFPTKYFLRGSVLSDMQEIEVYKFRLAEMELTSQVKSAYYNLLAKQSLLKIAEENVEIMNDFHNKADARLKVGEGTDLERLTAKIQFSEAKNSVEVQRNYLKKACTELNHLLGYGADLSDNDCILSDSLSLTECKLSFEEIYAGALSKNCRLKIDELNTNISSGNKSLAWSGLLPNLNFSYMKQERDGSTGFYGASFGISVPLWFMFDQKGQIEEATANVSIAESELKASKNLLFTKIKNAYNEFQINYKQIRFYLDEIIPEVNEIHRVALKSYSAGEISYLEYLQSKHALITAKSEYINLLLSYNNALAQLELAAGYNITN